jgi:hypothetical protein
VDRQTWHQPLICWITAAGDPTAPLVTSANRHITHVHNTEVWDGIEFTIEIAPSPYAKQAIFEKCMGDVLILAVTANRNFDGYTNKLVILFCDNCSGHCFEEALKKFAQHGILVLTCSPHTSPSQGV